MEVLVTDQGLWGHVQFLEALLQHGDRGFVVLILLALGPKEVRCRIHDDKDKVCLFTLSRVVGPHADVHMVDTDDVSELFAPYP